MAQYPTPGDRDFNLLQKLVSNTGDLAAGGGGGGSGTVTSVTSANANIGITNTTTTPVLTLASALTLVNSITASAATDLTLNAGAGANNSINLNPSGTGQVTITTGSNTGLFMTIASGAQNAFRANNNAGNADFGIDGNNNAFINAVTAGKSIAFKVQSVEKARFATTTGNLLLGGLTTDGTGVLQFPAATTSGGGITFSTDAAPAVNLYRSAAGTIKTDATLEVGSQIISMGSVATLSRNGGTGTVTVSGNAGSILLSPAGTAALALDANQRSSFTPGAIASGTTAYFKVQAPADTGLTTATESIGFNVIGATRTWVDGTVAVQREYLFQAPTYNKTTTTAVFTKAATLAVSAAPVAGTGVTLTSAYALWVQAGLTQLDGGVNTTSVTVNNNIGSATNTLLIQAGGGSTQLTINAGVTGGGAVFGASARTSGSASYFTINIPADTAQTAATESIGYQHVTAIRTWATTGTVALQRENFFAGPTYASAGASQTFTDAFTLYATPPIAGTNAIFTRNHTLGIVDATSAASAITGAVVIATTLGTAATSVGIGGGNVNAGGLITGGTVTSTGQFTASSTSTFTGAITQTAKTAKYNNITTAGWGQPAIYAYARSTAQVAAVASVATYTVGAADGTFIVAANVNVTAATTATFSATVTYLDENNTSRTATFSFVQNGVALPIQSITNVTGIGAYAGNPMMIRCKAATVITIATSGTFTSVTYNVEGFIEQVA